ncbi:hypothetical protein GSI_09076 [Ganoderma sinense ZZ0214-1]|uniref:DUF1793-domain-containing protein n=1 Tax=Ganoderma sinense ZZ0214-1 TaxID=1077348 RepID=A0A2G8S663_9APHY|nr:hypothetical protein GSI_09076 [Ganoderma sinense ZZ0214-1]
MRSIAFASLVAASAFGVGAITWSATPFTPAAVPLAVRSPYLSAWLPQGAGNALNDIWPQFWTGNSILGWAGFAKVDGSAYVWMGSPSVPNTTFSKATQKSLKWTSTQSIFVMTAGPVDLTITFLSPVEPNDFVNQSLPLSYYSISAASNDGKSHEVQVYVDISGEWVTGTSNPLINWSTTGSTGVITHQVQIANPIAFSEVNDRIQDGAVYHSTLNVTGTTYQTGQDIVVRALFINNGILANTQDTNFRPTSTNWPIFAFAHDFGAVTDSPATPVVYSVGHSRKNAVQYIILNNGRQVQSSYFWTRFSTMADAISSFLGDYNNAVTRANQFDNAVSNDANRVSSDYASLVALSVRQTFGAIEITVPQHSDGSFDTSNVLTFMKQMRDASVNTVDVIYPSWPLFLYTNATIGKSLIMPLLQYQTSGQYPNRWCVHDMGSNYPNATGHNDGLDTKMPIEESGNMVIMALSYAQRTDDLSWLKTYFAILDQWTQFLIADSLIPQNQLSTDVFAGPLANQTNLAIKGIVGIQAMAEIARATGDTGRYTNYSTLAASYVKQWQQFATSSTGSHLTLSYGDNDSWGMTYNLYADKLLGTNASESPLDPIHILLMLSLYSDWSIWTAATTTRSDVRDQIISAVVKYAADGKNSLPLSDWYDTIAGTQADPSSNYARPVVGGHLALLALQGVQNISSPDGSGSGNPTTSSGSPKPTSGSVHRWQYTATAVSSAFFIAAFTVGFVDYLL